jgi:hypothetical protein
MADGNKIMNLTELRNNLTEKLASLSEQQLNLVSQFVAQLELPHPSINNHEYEQKALQKWQYLKENNQELDDENPLTDQEIELICQVLSHQNKKRPAGLAQGEFTISYDFNEPLPEDIVDLFYQ